MFDSTKERDSLELKYLWLFQPSNELKVIYLPGNQTNSYTVTDDGSLEIDQIPGNGVFHCKHKNTIHAVYSITVVDTKTIKPELKTYIVDDFTNQEVSVRFYYHKLEHSYIDTIFLFVSFLTVSSDDLHWLKSFKRVAVLLVKLELSVPSINMKLEYVVLIFFLNLMIIHIFYLARKLQF